MVFELLSVRLVFYIILSHYNDAFGLFDIKIKHKTNIIFRFAHHHRDDAQYLGKNKNQQINKMQQNIYWSRQQELNPVVAFHCVNLTKNIKKNENQNSEKIKIRENKTEMAWIFF